MTDRISFTAITKPAVDAMADIQKRIDTATRDTVRKTGAETRKVARREAPVYKGADAVKIGAVKKARKAGVTLTGEKLAKGGLVEGKNQKIAGALRDSITVGRVRKDGNGNYAVNVWPRGPRVYLYSSKQEARRGFMAKAWDAAMVAVRAIHEAAWEKAIR